jgi:phosphoesterase family protein
MVVCSWYLNIWSPLFFVKGIIAYFICGHWHSSVPGETWPNRLFTVAGTSTNWVNNPPLASWLSHPFTIPMIFDVLTRYCPQTTWEYYAHDVAFLRGLCCKN